MHMAIGSDALYRVLNYSNEFVTFSHFALRFALRLPACLLCSKCCGCRVSRVLSFTVVRFAYCIRGGERARPLLYLLLAFARSFARSLVHSFARRLYSHSCVLCIHCALFMSSASSIATRAAHRCRYAALLLLLLLLLFFFLLLLLLLLAR